MSGDRAKGNKVRFYLLLPCRWKSGCQLPDIKIRRLSWIIWVAQCNIKGSEKRKREVGEEVRVMPWEEISALCWWLGDGGRDLMFKEHGKLLETRKSKDMDSSPEFSARNMADIWISATETCVRFLNAKNCQVRHFYCFKPLSLWSFVMAAISKPRKLCDFKLYVGVPWIWAICTIILLLLIENGYSLLSTYHKHRHCSRGLTKSSSPNLLSREKTKTQQLGNVPKFWLLVLVTLWLSTGRYYKQVRFYASMLYHHLASPHGKVSLFCRQEALSPELSDEMVS